MSRQGSCRPSEVRATTRVVVLPWVRGTEPLARPACGAQPERRTRGGGGAAGVAQDARRRLAGGNRRPPGDARRRGAHGTAVARVCVGCVQPSRRMAGHRVASRERRPLVRLPPGAVRQDGGIRGRWEPGAPERLLIHAPVARAAGNRQTRERAGRARLHHRALDGGHGDAPAASGCSQGLTVSHRSHHACFQVGRRGVQTAGHSTTCACLRLLQVALEAEHKGVVSGSSDTAILHGRLSLLRELHASLVTGKHASYWLIRRWRPLQANVRSTPQRRGWGWQPGSRAGSSWSAGHHGPRPPGCPADRHPPAAGLPDPGR
jgi:hypothetical protein